MRAFFDAFDAVPTDHVLGALGALLLSLGLVEPAWRLRGSP